MKFSKYSKNNSTGNNFSLHTSMALLNKNFSVFPNAIEKITICCKYYTSTTLKMHLQITHRSQVCFWTKITTPMN